MEQNDQDEQAKAKEENKSIAIGCSVWIFLIALFIWGNSTSEEPKAERYVPKETVKKETITKPILERAADEAVVEIKTFPLVIDADISVDTECKVIMMWLVLNAATNKPTALDTADSFIRIYSVLARHEGSGTTAPDKDTYGSLFDNYTILMGVAPSNAIDDRSRWYYNYAVSPGMHTLQGPSNPRWLQQP